MKWDFSNKDLMKLYTTGRSKKFPLPKSVIEDFFWLISIVDSAKDIYDFLK